MSELELEQLKEIRDELYEALPTGKIDAFMLIEAIQTHIDKLDKLINKN